jgi:hypothetical protein
MMNVAIPTEFIVDMLDVSLIGLVINNFYTQLYENGNGDYHQDMSPLNDIVTVDEWMQRILMLAQTQFQNLGMYPKSGNPTGGPSPNLINSTSIGTGTGAIFKSMKMPTPSYNSTTKQHEIIFYFSVNQYEKKKTNPDIIKQYYKLFFNDASASIVTWDTSNITPRACELTAVSPNPYSAFVILLNSEYTTSEILMGEEMPDTKYFVCAYGMKFTVDTWSPMLYAYFKYKDIDNFTESILDKVHHDTQMLPIELFNQRCTKENDQLWNKLCETDILHFCQMNYTGVKYANLIGNYLITIDSSGTGTNCNCINNRLSPTIDPDYIIPSMCFATACDNNTYVKGFGLTDEYCTQYCPVVKDWMTSTMKPTQSRDAQDLDQVRFRRICGDNYIPYSLGTLRSDILCIGIGISLTLMFILFLSLKKYNISTVKYVLYLTITGIITLGISIFLAFDLQGNPECDGKVSLCKSRITGININNQYCNYTAECECIFNNKCDPCGVNGTGVCDSGVCKSDTRGESTITVTKINYTYLITTCILIVLLPLVIYTLSTTYVKLNNTKILIPLVSLSVIIPSLLLMFLTFYRKNEKIYTKTCGGNPTDLSKFYANWNNVIIPIISTGIIILGISVYLLRNASKNIYRPSGGKI